MDGKVKLTTEELERRLTAEFPQMLNPQTGYRIEEVWFGGSRVRKHFDEDRCGRAGQSPVRR